MRFFVSTATAILVALAIAGTSAAPQPSGEAAGRRAARNLLLWRVDGPASAYLFGTIHVPDARVLQLPARVDDALAEASAVYTEIPMDLNTRLALTDHVTLPPHQRLEDILGTTLHARLLKTFETALSDAPVPDATATALETMLERLKPWAALGQLALLDYLPELAAGRQPLDALLYARAEADGKRVAGLETVDEQVAAFDRFTRAEQVAMLRAALDELDRARERHTTPARALVEAYLDGDLDDLNALLMDTAADAALARKFQDVMLVSRNRRMAERIGAIRHAEPSTVHFFAVGALHLFGPNGIPALLCDAGFRVTRLRH
ncbi:MAG: TraB/GumN family protein [Vicinamibacteraceae bacterium]